MAGAVCFSFTAAVECLPPAAGCSLARAHPLHTAAAGRRRVRAARRYPRRAILGFGASFFERLISMATGAGGSAFARSASPIEKVASSHQPSVMVLDVCSS